MFFVSCKNSVIILKYFLGSDDSVSHHSNRSNCLLRSITGEWKKPIEFDKSSSLHCDIDNYSVVNELWSTKRYVLFWSIIRVLAIGHLEYHTGCDCLFNWIQKWSKESFLSRNSHDENGFVWIGTIGWYITRISSCLVPSDFRTRFIYRQLFRRTIYIHQITPRREGTLIHELPSLIMESFFLLGNGTGIIF